MEWWQTALVAVVVALISGSVPTVLLILLQRKGANKRLELDETTVASDVFSKQTAAYSELYDTAKSDLAQAKKDLIAANKTAADLATELKKYQTEREELMAKVEEQGRKISRLERADNEKTDELADTRSKLETLRELFESYVARTGIPMTPEEQKIFEETKPKWLIKEEGRRDAE